MTDAQLLKNLSVPSGKIDVILDTDAFNEIDDQFAISYMLKSQDKLNIKGFCAAPFFNENSSSPADGMERSYHEIKKLLKLAKEESFIPYVFRGSDRFLTDETTPVESESADFIINTAKSYSPENPLYIVAIGAITNVASAFIKCPELKAKTVIVWLGGHALHIGHSAEFNMMHDIAAARVILGSGAPFVQLPCAGVVDKVYLTEHELNYWLKGKNELADYLAEHTIEAAERYAKGKPWSRVIWDITAVAWLLNDNDRFMSSRLIPAPVPEYDNRYGDAPNGHLIRYIYHINRDALITDLFDKIAPQN